MPNKVPERRQKSPPKHIQNDLRGTQEAHKSLGRNDLRQIKSCKIIWNYSTFALRAKSPKYVVKTLCWNHTVKFMSADCALQKSKNLWNPRIFLVFWKLGTSQKCPQMRPNYPSSGLSGAQELQWPRFGAQDASRCPQDATKKPPKGLKTLPNWHLKS